MRRLKTPGFRNTKTCFGQQKPTASPCVSALLLKNNGGLLSCQTCELFLGPRQRSVSLRPLVLGSSPSARRSDRAVMRCNIVVTSERFDQSSGRDPRRLEGDGDGVNLSHRPSPDSGSGSFV